ncbi:MAG: ATP-binding cassette domain-containing protein [Rhodobacteraceae bacterium]|nr:ATP-binding cassette domain-containing protein [Paracoccaceae bacterium]
MMDLTVKDLVLRSPSGRRLLDIPALAVPAGGVLAIAGRSGAGKSTLLFAVAGLTPVTAGSVTWGAKRLSALTEDDRTAFRREAVGMVFQDNMLFEELSAAENAALGALYAPRPTRGSVKEAASAALGAFGLAGADTRRAESYSGGERQRIAVARALSTDPAIVLADEPTASLDRATADALIADLMSNARDRGRTLVVASHDPALLSAADKVVTLEDGRLASDG